MNKNTINCTVSCNGKLVEVCVENIVMWFSYSTLIAIELNGVRYVCENIWSPTTNRHLAEIDGGDKEHRLDHKEFMNVVENIKATFMI